MAFCRQCGNEMREGVEFCAKCGSHLEAVSAAAVPMGVAAPTSGLGRPKSRKWLWLAIGCAAAVIIAVACILVFVVFQHQIFGGPTPEQTVERYMQASSEMDADAYLAVIDPDAVKAFKESNSLDGAAMKELVDKSWGYDSIKFSDIKMKTDMAEDGKSATVTVTVISGELAMVVDGDETVKDAADADKPVEFGLILKDGKWYMDERILDAFSSPEQTVGALLQAIEDKDIDAYLAAIDPESLASLNASYGFDDATFRQAIVDTWTYDSMEFSGIEMEAVMASDGKSATVKIIAGKATAVTAGQEEVTDFSAEPTEFPVVLRDGKWYLDVAGLM